MTRKEELAWAAGFFEGEGCFFLHKQRNGRIRRGTATLSNTDFDVLKRFHTIIGVGKIYKVNMKNSKYKQAWQWRLSAREQFDYFASLVEPYLGKRRLEKLNEIKKLRTREKDLKILVLNQEGELDE